MSIFRLRILFHFKTGQVIGLTSRHPFEITTVNRNFNHKYDISISAATNHKPIFKKTFNRIVVIPRICFFVLFVYFL
jgi:hypothetical protein